jgi:tetratricopeptide (TPR) repeat protein
MRWSLHWWLGYHRFAAHHFQSAIELRPKHLLAYFLLGWTYGKLGLYERAISIFDIALQMAPSRAYPHAHKALCYMYLGRNQEAAHGFERAFRIEPRYRTLPLFVDSLARCRANLGHSTLPEQQ